MFALEIVLKDNEIERQRRKQYLHFPSKYWILLKTLK